METPEEKEKLLAFEMFKSYYVVWKPYGDQVEEGANTV